VIGAICPGKNPHLCSHRGDIDPFSGRVNQLSWAIDDQLITAVLK